MRIAVIALATVHFLALALFGAEFALTAARPEGPSPAGRLFSLAMAVVLPLALPALWLAWRDRALPFALALVTVLPVALGVVWLLR